MPRETHRGGTQVRGESRCSGGTPAGQRDRKGAYLVVEKTERGGATTILLKQILPEVILATPFPKKMRWADLDIEFARPIHGLALYGKQVIQFQLGN